MDKEIIIIDAFINGDESEKKLSEFVDRIKSINLPILIISNTIIPKYIIEKVDYYIYDSNNRLFDDIFEGYEKFILWEILNDIKFNTIHVHKQRHALSVIVNLFNVISFIDNLGFKYFHRIEYDTILGNKTLNLIKNVKDKVIKEDKKGYFMLNQNKKTHKFQYFFSETNNFHNILPKMNGQYDYLNLLNNLYGSKKFVHIERLMYDLLVGYESVILTYNDGEEVNDTIWNTETSKVHLEGDNKRFITNLYIGNDYNIVLSKNHQDEQINRDICLYNNEKKIDNLTHSLSKCNEYVFHIIEKYVDKITVMENGLEIKTIVTADEENFFEK
jgi:hypothetical protein